MYPELSIVIPATQIKPLVRLVDSIRNNPPSYPYEVVIVDDSGSRELASLQQDPLVKIVFNSENIGPARSRNIGARTACAERLLFLDSDVEVQAGFFEQLKLSATDDTTVVGLYDYPTSHESFLTRYYHYRLIRGYERNNATPVPILGAVFSVTQKVFWAVEGFDERYRYASVEDIDLSRRLSLKKCEVKIDLSLRVIHHKKMGALDLLRNDYSRSRDRVHLLFKPSGAEKKASAHFDHSERIYMLSLFAPLFLAWALIMPSMISVAPALFFTALVFYYHVGMPKERDSIFLLKASIFVWVDYIVIWIGLLIGLVSYLLGKQKHLYHH